MSILEKITSALDCFTLPKTIDQGPEHRQARLLAWILLFLFLFSAATLLILYFVNPHHDAANKSYALLISGLLVSFVIAFVLNCRGYYYPAATLLVSSAILTPWISLFIDPSVINGDILPLTYITFSILLSSIFLHTSITFTLAMVQFLGIMLVFLFSPVDASLNWFSFLAYVFLTSVFSILTNSIIQRDMRQIAKQAEKLRLNEALLREQSIHDYLTGLFNRRYLEETLEREILRGARKQTPVGIILLDVDNFKHINDTFGHPAGDIVLQGLGKFLSSQIRQSDLACRYGGDEFVLVLPETSRETTLERAEQLCKGTKTLDLPTIVTISLGVAVFPTDGTEIQTLLKSADEALFRAKHGGGDLVA